VPSRTSHQYGGRSNEKEGNKFYFFLRENSEGRATWDSPFVGTSWLLLSPNGEKFLFKVVFFDGLPQYNARALFMAPRNERSKIVSKENNRNYNIYSLSAEKFGYFGKMILSSRHIKIL
jgi:hypothetical protein